MDQRVDPGGHLFAGFEPGAGSELLPNGLGSVGHEEQSDGSHADFGAFGNIGGQAEEDRVDLIGKFTKIKIEFPTGDYVERNYLLRDDEDDAVEGKDGADAFGGVVELAGSAADDGQQNGDDLLDAEGTESRQSDDAVNSALAGLVLLDEQRQELVDDDGILAVAEVAQNGDGEALGGHETRSASGVQQISDGHQSGLLHNLGGLNGVGLPQVLEMSK